MASSRMPGRGRVLGAGSPARISSPLPSTPQSRPPILPEVRVSGLESPPENTASLVSEISIPKTSIEDDDISSAVAFGTNTGTIGSASASTRLVCPICNEDMVTLLQLNRHLDDNHRNLEVVQQDEVKNWFKTRMMKAKRFQPLAVINQKLKGLDVFESNEDLKAAATPMLLSPSVAEPQQQPQPVVAAPPRPVQTEEAVTREHWQRHSQDNACSDPMCGRRLGSTNGSVNCRKCGKLFCDEHTMYQMKLSRSAHHEPVRGFWCRVCETCYKSREGYSDRNGAERDHLVQFASMRRKAVDASYLEITRLEKRITKLTQVLSDPSLQEQQSVVGYFRSFSGATNQKRLMEQTVVDWEDDTTVQHCPFCHQDFSSYSFRRHHCRLCGKVVCADPSTGCSSEVALDVARRPATQSEKDRSQMTLKIRMCKDCNHTVFSKSDFAREVGRETPDLRAFQNLKQFERGIRTMLPRFQRLIIALQHPDKPPSLAELTEATKVRKRLTDSFTQYSVAASRIRDLPTASATQARLQRNIYSQASSFLHLHMLPLKSLPKILKHASPYPAAGLVSDGHLGPNGELSRGRLAVIRSSSDSPSVDSSSAVSSIENEEKELRETLIVLEEQKFMVGEMLSDAQRRRKFEEVESLGKNLEDLSKEIDSIQGQLSSLDFESAYVGAGLASITANN